ncbi:hypothetical protein BH23PLA1_BH23PLA1_37560 [soil metagenome]
MEERTTISIPTDSEGFISRKCPACSKRFKVTLGQGSDKPLTHCPYWPRTNIRVTSRHLVHLNGDRGVISSSKLAIGIVFCSVT